MRLKAARRVGSNEVLGSLNAIGRSFVGGGHRGGPMR